MSTNPSQWLHASHLRCLLWLCAMLLRPAFEEARSATQDVWIGTGSAWPSQGIYHAQLDLDTGKLSRPTLAAEVSGPGFLAMHPKGTHLYAAGSLVGVPSVIAYKIAQEGPSTLQPFGSAAIGQSLIHI